jgi:Fic family protein
MRRQFTRSALQCLSGASGATVEQYTRMLERHGYIRKIAKEGKEKLYLLCKDVGPKRPKGMEAADGR